MKKTGKYTGLFLYLFFKVFYVSSNFQTGNLTCPIRHSSRYRQHSRSRLRRNNSRNLPPTYRFVSFYPFYSYFHLPVISHPFPAVSPGDEESSQFVDLPGNTSTALEVRNKTTLCIRPNKPDNPKLTTNYRQSNYFASVVYGKF
jgi:hypothetical protein